MSLLDNLTQMIGGQAGGESGVLGHVMDLVNNPASGGLQGIVQQFQSNGLGEAVSSWVGSGANQSISADQIMQVIGQDKVNEIASKVGMDPSEVSGLIAQHLPSVIDKLTPGGSVQS